MVSNYLPSSVRPGCPEDCVHSVMLVVVYSWFPKKFGLNSGSSFIPICILTITPLVEVIWMPLQPKEAANTTDLYHLAPAGFSKPTSSTCFSGSPEHQPCLPDSPRPLVPLSFMVLTLARNALPTASSIYQKSVHPSNPSSRPASSWGCQFLQLELITSLSSLP